MAGGDESTFKKIENIFNFMGSAVYVGPTGCGQIAKFLDKRLSGLKWISPNYSNPEEELKNIKSFFDVLKAEENYYENNRMIINEYSLTSVLLNTKLHSPSRTYASISYPLINSTYYKIYQNYFINNIKRNNIRVIYIFLINKINDEDLNFLIFNYINANCFSKKKYESNVVRLLIKNNCNFTRQ